MKFSRTKLEAADIVNIEPREKRREFAQCSCPKVFDQHGLTSQVAPAKLAFKTKNDSLRGTQAQLPPQQEVQLVHCAGDAAHAGGAVHFVR